MDLQWWESRTYPGAPQYWMNVRDRETGVSASALVGNEWSEAAIMARDDLERAVTERVRSYVCFTLACQVTNSAPVLFAGGPLDGTRQDLPLAAEGSKPEPRHMVIVEPAWGNGRKEPRAAFHSYERGDVPQIDPDKPVVWLYRHIDQSIPWRRK